MTLLHANALIPAQNGCGQSIIWLRKRKLPKPDSRRYDPSSRAQEDGFTLIEVKDNGNDMEQDKAAHLLSPTVKGKNGLSNTNRQLTRLYGQGLSIVSKPDEGTTVSYVIPASATQMKGARISGRHQFQDYNIH